MHDQRLCVRFFSDSKVTGDDIEDAGLITPAFEDLVTDSGN